MFLFPSLSDTFGNVVMEALASALPVVSFDVAAAAEHVDDGVSGRLVAARRRGRASSPPSRPITDPSLPLAPMRAAALAAARRATWPEVLARFEARLEDTVHALEAPSATRSRRGLSSSSLWIERERSVALWMHGASTRAWVVRVLAAVSRVGDGWLWYAIIACLPWAGGAGRHLGVGADDLRRRSSTSSSTRSSSAGSRGRGRFAPAPASASARARSTSSASRAATRCTRSRSA